MVYPSNVIHLATECSNRNHRAAFPIELPRWFIKLFTLPDDIVLDPFVGSGTTAQAAIQLGRSYTGIEIDSTFVQVARNRVMETQIGLPIMAETPAEYQDQDNSEDQLGA